MNRSDLLRYKARLDNAEACYARLKRRKLLSDEEHHKHKRYILTCQESYIAAMRLFRAQQQRFLHLSDV